MQYPQIAHKSLSRLTHKAKFCFLIVFFRKNLLENYDFPLSSILVSLWHTQVYFQADFHHYCSEAHSVFLLSLEAVL